MKRKFWNWVKNEGDETRTLYLSGEISDETWFGDEVTPKLFKDELMAGTGDITLWINSPGGDVFAAAQIYNMLMDYPGHVTVKIDGLRHCHGRQPGGNVSCGHDDDPQSHHGGHR